MLNADGSLRLLRLGFPLPLRDFLSLEGDLRLRSEPLIVLVLHDFFDANVPRGKMQSVVSLGVSGKPIRVVNLFPPGREFGKKVFVAFLLLDIEVGYSLAVGLHDLEIVIVYPDASLKIPLLTFDLLGRNVEHIATQFIFLLLARVNDLVFRNLVAGQYERQSVLNIVEI